MPVEAFLKECGALAGMFDCFAGSHDRLFSAEGRLDLAFHQRERLLEVVPVGRRAAAGRDEHVDQAVAAAVSSPERRIVYMPPARPMCGRESPVSERAIVIWR